MKGRTAAILASCVAACIGLACTGQGRKEEGYSWEKDLQYRLRVDFCRSRAEVTSYIRKYIPDVTQQQIDEWTQDGRLENMTLDGEVRYFRNAAPNLFRIDPACKAIKDAAEGGKDDSGSVSLSGNSLQGYEAVDKEHLPEILSSPRGISTPKWMRVRYSITLDGGTVPAGETVRVWLPFPRKDVPRQKDVEFLGAWARDGKGRTLLSATPSDPSAVHFSDPSCAHSTLYMEVPSTGGKMTFSEEFSYTSYAQYEDDVEGRVLPYDKSSDMYREYTAPRPPHMVFSDRIKTLADEITCGIDNPFLQARAIFTYISTNFPWASAREYSTQDNIPEYVLDHRHGDCGMVTLLFCTMCRYKGIPTHFQSGFMMHPGGWNLHDWAEAYFEGVGWVPVDQSFGIPPYACGEYLEKNPLTKYFFASGIDSWRMVVNEDWGKPLDPVKTYPRSETVDFQRGELEWKGGNIYFPHWDYDMEIQYLR